jgi:N-acetylglutamate synthase-like GNAT family acetyltransferase
MNDAPQEWSRDGLVATTDRAKIDPDQTLALLHTTWWAGKMTRENLTAAISESLTFVILDGERLIGVARVVTDRTTFGYLTDVVIAEDRRGAGLGRWLIECVIAHRDLQSLRRLALLTSEAPWLYEKLGFVAGAGRSAYFEKKGPGFSR